MTLWCSKSPPSLSAYVAITLNTFARKYIDRQPASIVSSGIAGAKASVTRYKNLDLTKTGVVNGFR